MLSKILKIATVAVIAVGTLVGCTRVEPNEVGVLMTNYGRDVPGDFSIVTGRVTTIAPGTTVFKVPLYEQRGTYDAKVTLKASDNTEFHAIPVYSYKVIKDDAVNLIVNNMQILKSGGDFMLSLQDNVLEPKIFDIMKEESRKYTTDELMAKGGSLAFEQKLEERVRAELEGRGLELVTFSSQLEFSQSVTQRIDKRNEVNQNIAVIDQQIEEQKKRLELAKLQSETNKVLSEGITPSILQQQFIEKWDGKTPLYGDTPVMLMKQP